MKSLRDEFFVLRVDSMRVMMEGTLPGPWTQARTRSWSEEVTFFEAEEERSPSLRRVPEGMSRAGL